MEVSRSGNGETKDCWVTYAEGQSSEIGKLLRLTRHVAVFETYAPSSALQMSQVLTAFKILVQGNTIYSGRAVIRGLIHAGVAFVCEVSLDDRWLDAPGLLWPAAPEAAKFTSFIHGWQRFYKVAPEFKVAVADLHAFLSDLRIWLDQQELAVNAGPPEQDRDRSELILRGMEEPVMQTIDLLHQRFEEIGDSVSAESRPAHQHFARRHLHPLFLCAPFGYRAYHKPLGYAGDYEMVNMILRPPYEGSSLFAQVMNMWLLRQYPSEAHRNRIDYLVDLLKGESLRRQVRDEVCRIVSIGCGPAHEIQRFLVSTPLADRVRIELIDMNDETLAHTASLLEALKIRHGRRTTVETRKRSVLSLLRDAARPAGTTAARRHDFIYCAGLFDYLTDPACQQLLKLCWDWLAPGGLLVATNVDTFRPFRHMLEFLLDWHLNYRNQAQMRALLPADIPADAVSITSDATGVNLFLEIRRSVSG
jgi:extracellular factor (EF) 3-hydroxypalmitic acid methyl ester biosynthesis protein